MLASGNIDATTCGDLLAFGPKLLITWRYIYASLAANLLHSGTADFCYNPHRSETGSHARVALIMWREKKRETTARQTPMAVPLSPEKPIEVEPMVEPIRTHVASSTDPGRTQLGRTMVVKGDLSGSEDLLIAGQFEGTINVQGHSLTVGPEAKVKADIQAARVVIYGSVHGNISVKERLDIYKTGHVVGDLASSRTFHRRWRVLQG